jgi:hypothetical protein
LAPFAVCSAGMLPKPVCSGARMRTPRRIICVRAHATSSSVRTRRRIRCFRCVLLASSRSLSLSLSSPSSHTWDPPRSFLRVELRTLLKTAKMASLLSVAICTKATGVWHASCATLASAMKGHGAEIEEACARRQFTFMAFFTSPSMVPYGFLCGILSNLEMSSRDALANAAG